MRICIRSCVYASRCKTLISGAGARWGDLWTVNGWGVGAWAKQKQRSEEKERVGQEYEGSERQIQLLMCAQSTIARSLPLDAPSART